MKKSVRLILSFALVFSIITVAGVSYGEDQYLAVKTAIQSGMPQVAILELKANREMEKDPLYWLYLGTACREAGKYDDAVSAFMSGLKLNSRNSGLLDGLGVTYAKTGDYPRAVDSIKKALDLEPTNPKYYNDLGLVYLLQKEADMAMNSFSTSFKLSQSIETVKNLSFAYGMKGDYKKARELLMDAFPLHEVYYILGQAHELNSETEKAVELYKMSTVAKKDYKPAREKLITMGISGDEI
ncbi:MAG: tetratricopeptide repeat protein [Thermodesulfovibrionales bacterium]|jgi:Flp pilus assembly protein TadD